MHKIHALEDEPMAEMNLIPMIDVALTLLIIMMVTTVFIRHPGVSLKLPETATREGAPETKKDLTVVVTADGSLYMDGQKKTEQEVQSQLLALSARDRNARVLVKGDRDVVYARVMEVMDMVRQAGLTRVVLPTEPKLSAPRRAGVTHAQTKPADGRVASRTEPAAGSLR
ncbi:MAG: ExbD/TolR family protein [Chthonomonadales bacterium]